MMKPLCRMIVFIFLIFMLASCKTSGTPRPDGEEIQDVGASAQEQDETLTEGRSDSVEETNLKTIAESRGKRFQLCIPYKEKNIVIDGDVSAPDVQHIGYYEYSVCSISESQRENLFKAAFDADKYGFEHNTYMNNDFWEIKRIDDGEEYYTFNVQYDHSGPGISDEEIFNLLNRNANLDDLETNQLQSLEASSLYPAMESILDRCQRLVSAVAPDENYGVDYIRPFGVDGASPFLWVIYARSIDGVPVTAYRDLKFYVDEKGVEYFGGALYKIGETILEEPILSVDEAVEAFAEQVPIFFDEQKLGVAGHFDSQIVISKITLEYLVVKDFDDGPKIVPIWRFQLGSDEASRNLLRDRVLAVDAIQGNLIAERRRDTF